ncbi:hypothetical protein Trisim1_009325 [Trichoderma cf. simile WF8]
MDSYETASVPLRRHQPSFTRTITEQAVERLESTSDGSSASPNLVLLTKLVRMITTRDLPEFHIVLDSNTSLGTGATYEVSKATVYSLREEYGGQRIRHTFAVKIAKLSIGRTFSDMGTNAAERRRLKVVLFELDVLSRPSIRRHRNIVSLMGVSWGETAYGYAPSLVMELATMGTAREYTSAEPMLSDSKRLALCRDVASGLDFLHSVGIVHGDVKQDNVLIFADTNAAEGFVAKLSDLERCPANHDALKYTGTTLYNAPEVRTLGSAEQRLLWLCDVFSFGLLSFEVFSGVTWKHVLGDTDDTCMGKRARDEWLELACDFIKNSWQGSNTLRSICQDIARATLTDDPLKRLPLGWNMILRSLQHNDDVEMEVALIEEPTQLIDSDASYSILEIHTNIRGISDDTLGDAMWFDLTHTISSTNDMGHKGNSAFNLFVLYSLGRYGKFEKLKEALKYLEIAAECQYGPAFVVGKRMFEANGLGDDLPQVFVDGPKDSDLRQKIDQLESLPNDMYYSSAIRTFWPCKLRADALRIVSKRLGVATMELGEGHTFDLASNIRQIKSEQASEAEFCALAEASCLLHYGVLNSDYAACKLLLELQCDVNSTMPGGMTPLHLACCCVEMEIMELLLSHGADASLCDEKNISPLHWLVLLPNENIRPMANLIMSHCKKAQIKFASMKSQVPIFFDDLGLILEGDPISWAVSCCNLAAVQAIFDLSFMAAADEKEAQHHLSSAIGNVCASIMEYLLKFCKHISAHDKEDMYRFFGSGVSSFTRWLIHGSAHDKTLGEALDLLERSGFPLPLNRRDMVNNKAPYTPLGVAVTRYDIPIIKELIKRGANVNDTKDRGWDGSMLLWAFASADATGPRHKVIDTMKLLLDHGATNAPEPPLHAACSYGVDPSIFQLLINRDSQAIRTIYHGQTPLLCLLGYGIKEDLMAKVKLLIDIPRDDLDIESFHTGRDGDCCCTALAYSLISLEWDIAELLLDRDVSLDLGIKGGHRQSVLHLLIHHASRILSRKQNVEWGVLLGVLDKLLRYLASKGRNIVNTIDHNGNTPLRLAINYGLPSIVKKLLWRDYGIFKETVQGEYALLQQSLLTTPHSGIMRGQMNVITELLEACLNVDEAVINS